MLKRKRNFESSTLALYRMLIVLINSCCVIITVVFSVYTNTLLQRVLNTWKFLNLFAYVFCSLRSFLVDTFCNRFSTFKFFNLLTLYKFKTIPCVSFVELQVIIIVWSFSSRVLCQSRFFEISKSLLFFSKKWSENNVSPFVFYGSKISTDFLWYAIRNKSFKYIWFVFLSICEFAPIRFYRLMYMLVCIWSVEGNFDMISPQIGGWTAFESYCMSGSKVISSLFEVWKTILCPIESVDSSVPVCMKVLKNSRWFRPRRAVGVDGASGAIESNCPSGSKSSRIFQNFHADRDGTVHTRWDRV